jgi:hydroxymethylpyrimidine/phosphomethylpyrimidine kinase
MVAKGGSPLLKPDAIDAVRALLIPRAALITPNIPEAELLTGIAIETASDMQRAGEALLNLGAQAALIKGGHLAGDTLMDVLVSHEGAVQWQSLRIKSEHTHGTGCTLASAIATCLAHGIPVADSVARARDYVLRAIGAAPRFGSGHGPLNHQVRA